MIKLNARRSLGWLIASTVRISTLLKAAADPGTPQDSDTLASADRIDLGAE